jgi:hypothetical protein
MGKFVDLHKAQDSQLILVSAGHFLFRRLDFTSHNRVVVLYTL